MNTKDLSRMVGSDTSPRVPGEFVRYDENGTVPGVGYVITATTQAAIDGITFPKLSATDVANIANAIKEGKSVSIYDATADVYFVPVMAAGSSETKSSFIILDVYKFAIVNYQVNGDMVSVSVLKFNTRTT